MPFCVPQSPVRFRNLRISICQKLRLDFPFSSKVQPIVVISSRYTRHRSHCNPGNFILYIVYEERTIYTYKTYGKHGYDTPEIILKVKHTMRNTWLTYV